MTLRNFFMTPERGQGAGQISSGTPFCRINAAFHPAAERRIYAAAKNSVVRKRGQPYVFGVRRAAVPGSSNVSTPSARELYQISPALKPAAPETGALR